MKQKSLVYVIAYDGTPLMPCEPVIARLILKNNKAKVLKREPFVIKLLYETTKYIQAVTVGIDLGSSEIGAAAVDENNNVLYMSKTKVRNNIKQKMDKRRSYRKTRRNRKTRYRKARWQNRKNSKKKGRITPTVRSKIQAHERVIRETSKILPISQIVLETGKFDPHLLKNPTLANPKIIHWGYQKGELYGFDNAKSFVLKRDEYTCQICGKTKGRMEVHHIVFKSQNGSDEPKNLATLCDECHSNLHKDKLTGSKKKKADSLKGNKRGTLMHATQMNAISKQLMKLFPDATETFGYITKHNREKLGLAKEHYIDAVVIASNGNVVNFKTNVFLRHVCISKGEHQRTKGVRSEKNMPKGKIKGFMKYDKVRYLGRNLFIKGRASTGYAQLMDIDENKQIFISVPKGMKTPKLCNMVRLQARSNQMTEEMTIAS